MIDQPTGAPWLTALAASALLSVSIITALVRAQAVNEGYTVALQEERLLSTRRHLVSAESSLLCTFAQLKPAGEVDNPQISALDPLR